MEKLLGYNMSVWSWEYDSHFKEIFIYKNKTGYRILITDTYTKSGLGAGEEYRVIDDFQCRRIDIAQIRSLMKRNGFNRTRSSFPFNRYWTDENGNKKTLNEILKKR